MTNRKATIRRETRETKIELTLNLDGSGASNISTGLGFFDHMLSALVTHARMDLDLKCEGDLYVDDHHTIEDCGLAIGRAIDESLGDRSGITRFGSAYAPLDESLARAVIDLSGRPSSSIQLDLKRDQIGPVACENLTHFFVSLATASRSTIHVDVLRGDNDHHKIESAFKALALALRQAVTCDTRVRGVPSTKGSLE